MPLYRVTVLPGLEPVLIDEARVKLPLARIRMEGRGKVAIGLESAADEHLLYQLRTADNLYRHLHRFSVGPHRSHLPDMERELARLHLSLPGLLLPGRAAGKEEAGSLSCKVNASRAGKHSYSRFEAAEAAERGLVRGDRRLRIAGEDRHELEFRLDIRDETAELSLRLTDASFRYRGGIDARAIAPAALRPSVAHGLVWLSQPKRSDRWLEPCCGSGTLVFERAFYPYKRIEAGDSSSEAVRAAAIWTSGLARVRVREWDARHLPLDAGGIDKVAANLPFGRQVSAGADIPALYRDMLREFARVLAADGSAVCMTDACDPLERAADRNGLRCERLTTLSLKGLHPSVFRLTKR